MNGHAAEAFSTNLTLQWSDVDVEARDPSILIDNPSVNINGVEVAVSNLTMHRWYGSIDSTDGSQAPKVYRLDSGAEVTTNGTAATDKNMVIEPKGCKILVWGQAIYTVADTPSGLLPLLNKNETPEFEVLPPLYTEQSTNKIYVGGIEEWYSGVTSQHMSTGCTLKKTEFVVETQLGESVSFTLRATQFPTVTNFTVAFAVPATISTTESWTRDVTTNLYYYKHGTGVSVRGNLLTVGTGIITYATHVIRPVYLGNLYPRTTAEVATINDVSKLTDLKWKSNADFSITYDTALDNIANGNLAMTMDIDTAITTTVREIEAVQKTEYDIIVLDRSANKFLYVMDASDPYVFPEGSGTPTATS